jgi:hypothetical protein
MRDDSDVHFVLLGALVLAFVTQIFAAFGRGADDTNWELRYRSLDDLDQAWIAAASRTSTSRPALEERGELDLAKGFSRHERRRRAFVEVAALPMLIAVGVFALAGILPSSLLGLALIGDFAVRGGVEFWRDRQIKTGYRQVQERHLVMAGAQPTPAL